ncbi:MAG: HAMP domain-containing sensor histidine kinase [Caulobacteraceae bacterium]
MEAATSRPPLPGGDAGLWHVVWTVVLAVASGGRAMLSGWDPIALSLAVMVLPALTGWVFWRGRSGFLALLLWAAAGAFSAMLMGGVSGPLGVFCLTPVAAAAAVGGRRRMSEGGALAAVSAASVLLFQLAGVSLPYGLDAVSVSGSATMWLGAFALGAVGLSLAAGLLMSNRRTAEADRRAEAEASRLRSDYYWLEYFLHGQPHLLLLLDHEGHVKGSFGRPPEGIDISALSQTGLISQVFDGDRPTVVAAIDDALAHEWGEAGFAPEGSPDRWMMVAFARLGPDELAASIRDATTQRAYEAGLEQARTDAEALNAGKSRFLANMSHELRTPLNAIIGFSDIMRTAMFGPLADKYAEYAGLIHESGGHLLDLINDVLDMSKIEAERYDLAREEFDAREAVSAALRLVRLQADGNGVTLRGVLPAQPLEVDADRRALKQIVLNLVSNALKFTNRGGQVTVTARPQGEYLEIIVADSGVGISAADLERLGKPYEQAGEASQRAKGTGLGLSLVRAFAELHGGTMAIESTLGEGTAVTVRLPVLLAVQPAAPDPATFAGNVVAFKPQR